ncbi:MAG: nucleotidyltransferase [Blastochloris sp.]|nr:nucleotidyltransferase [Blastochloris sp.]
MGTVIRPLNPNESYDLDLGCRLRSGITKASHTQEFLKKLVGKDLEAYRVARKIEERLEEMHRCWRLAYADELSFHMDVVPSIPQDGNQITFLQESMIKQGTSDFLAGKVAKHAGAITDNRHPDYRIISGDWRISNSEGYALWFESRLRLAGQLLEKRAFEAKVAKMDDLPAWKWKSPLQQCIQILKRHRDVMFKNNPDRKPISIILTTLSAAAYQGENSVEDSLRRILTDMSKYVLPSKPRVPNPVNPAEDFADKWHDQKYSHLNLEGNFKAWLEQAQTDFGLIERSANPESVVKQASAKFGINLDDNMIKRAFDEAEINIISKTKSHVITETPPKPWMKE